MRGVCGTLMTTLLLAPLMAGCLTDGATLEAAVEPPQWRSGYAFTWLLEGQAQGSASANGKTDNADEAIGPYRWSEEVLNTTLRAGGDPVYVAAWDLSGFGAEEWGDELEAPLNPYRVLSAYRQSDLAPTGVRWSPNACETPCTDPGDVQLRAPPQQPFLAFPLEKGKQWTSSTTDETQADDSGQGVSFGTDSPDVFRRATVAGTRDVTTGVGSVSTVRVEMNTIFPDLAEVEQEMRQEMERGGCQVETVDFDISQSDDIYYAPRYQNIVRQDSHAEVSMTIQAVCGSQPIDISIHVRADVQVTLDGARLVAGPERDGPYVHRVLGGSAPVADASGQRYNPAGYAITIAPAAPGGRSGDTHAFSLAIDGEVPDDHEFQWRIVRSDAAEATAYEGDAIDHTFAEGGLYHVSAYALDADGTIAASHGIPFRVDHHAISTAACPVAAVDRLAMACDAVDVPILAGAQHLSLAARPAGLAGDPATGAQLVLLDDTGDVVAEGTQASAGVYAIDQRVPNDLGNGPWTLQIRHTAAVPQDVEYEILVVYQSATGGDEANASLDPAATAYGHAQTLLDQTLSGLLAR